MIVSHRRTSLDAPPAAPAYLETHALVHTRFRIHVVRNDRVVSEDRLHLRAFERRGMLGRPIVTAVLEGNARIDAYDREVWLGAGEVSAIESKGAIAMRQSRNGERYVALAIEWDPGSLDDGRPTGFETRKLGAAALARLLTLAEQLTRRDLDAPAAAELATEILAHLGFPRRSASSLVEEVSESTRVLAASLDELLSDLRRKPMAVDLHDVLGLSLRQVNRLVLEFNLKYGFNAVGWRDTRGRRRLMMGATLMTAPGATVQAVARAVGYASPTAFARAMALSGLPPPGEVARCVAALR
jgi:AraC-like DNA-binding protein